MRTDKGIPHQQNLARFDLAIVLLRTRSNSYEDLVSLMEQANALLREARPGTWIRVG